MCAPNTIDTGFIERELKVLTPDSAAPGDLELCAAVAAIVSNEEQARRPPVPRRWQTAWLDAGRASPAGVRIQAWGRAPSSSVTLSAAAVLPTLSIGTASWGLHDGVRPMDGISI